MTAVARVLVALIWLYRRVVSPVLPAHCRYHPTCSEYAARAIHQHGAVYGGWMAARRVARCHPWAVGGIDPVPARRRG